MAPEEERRPDDLSSTDLTVLLAQLTNENASSTWLVAAGTIVRLIISYAIAPSAAVAAGAD